MFKLTTTYSDKCNFCHETDTIMHMSVECTNDKELWTEIAQCVSEKIQLDINFNRLDIIFGNMKLHQYKVPVNTLLLVTKNTYLMNIETIFYSLNILKFRLQHSYEKRTICG